LPHKKAALLAIGEINDVSIDKDLPRLDPSSAGRTMVHEDHRFGLYQNSGIPAGGEDESRSRTS
jgi:hypothetical protein